MRNIMGMFVRDRGSEKAQEAINDFKLQTDDANIKVTAINLFKDLGKLIDRQIKEKITDKGKRRKT